MDVDNTLSAIRSLCSIFAIAGMVTLVVIDDKDDNQTKKLDNQVTEVLGKQGYTIEATGSSKHVNDVLQNTYTFSRNDSLFNVTASYEKVGDAGFQQAKILKKDFAGMKLPAPKK